MSYTCNLCDFKTERSYDLKVHERTVKHLKNVGLVTLEKSNNIKNKYTKPNNIIINDKKKGYNEDKNDYIKDYSNENSKEKNHKVYKCECNKEFRHYQNLWRHRKICNFINNDLVIITKAELTEIKDLKQSNINLIAKVEALTNIIETKQIPIVMPPPININMTDNSINTTNMSNVVKYVNQNYINAQPLEMLQSAQAKNLLMAQTTKEHSVEELMIYYYDKRTLDKFIGKIIKSEYKKDDPEIQQFWTTDVSRLSFLVRRVMKENDKMWINDKKGILVKKYIITPILVEVKGMIDKYQKYCKYRLETQCMTLKLDDLEKLGNISITCEALSLELDGGTIHDLVLKYITPCFQLEN